MNSIQLRWLIILFLIGVTVLFGVMGISGCGLYERTKDFIFNPSQPDQSIVPETPKGQLWQTIKGLTPNWLAIPVIALGAVAMFNGAAKLGMSCIIFGSVNLFMALATSRFGFWMAVCGLVGSGLAVTASILAKNKALRDIICNVQGIKDIVPEINKEAIKFKLGEQVDSTKKIVAKIKNNLKLKGIIP